MTGHNLQTRIVKLETKTSRPDEILVVWRKRDCDVAEALKGAVFAKGDRVICAEWFEDGPPPAPRWYGGRLRSAMDPSDYEHIERTIERVAASSATLQSKPGFAPFPSFKEMTDAELIHAVLGVDT